MVNNPGDCKSPGVVGPLPNDINWLINGGDPNYFLTGMILQAPFLRPRHRKKVRSGLFEREKNTDVRVPPVGSGKSS